MKASLRSVRIAPKKANLIAKMVRGMPVQDAIASLQRTHKKAARLIEDLLQSAVANAVHNDKQDPASLMITSIVVNQGQAYRRGVPKARGQVRPIKKFLSHIHVELGLIGSGKTKKIQKSSASQETDSGVQKEQPEAKKRTRTSTKKSAKSSSSDV